MTLGLILFGVGVGLVTLAVLTDDENNYSGGGSVSESPMQKIRDMDYSEARDYWNNELTYSDRCQIRATADITELETLKLKGISSVEWWSDEEEW